MQLSTTTKVVTLNTRTHSGTFSADEVLAAVKVMAKQSAKDAGVTDDQVDTVSAKAVGDGSYTVEIVEKAAAAPVATAAPTGAPGLNFGGTPAH